MINAFPAPAVTAAVAASRRRPRRGVAALFVTVVLLLAVGVVALYTNRGAVIEQRLSANDVRAKQALAAANAGIDHALAYTRNGGIDQDKNGVVDTIVSNTLGSSGGAPSNYTVAFVRTGTALPACPTTSSATWPAFTAPRNPTEVVAVSCGWSDDNSSVQRVVQAVTTTPATAGGISTPLVSKSTTNLLTGGASILNYFNDLTVWSGGSLLGQSNTGKTFIRDVASKPTASVTDPYRNTGNSPACNNPPSGYTCSTQGSKLGHDTVGGDTNLSSMSADNFFKYFMGQSPSLYRDNTVTWLVDPAGTLPNRNSTDVNSLVNMTGNTIWVEGNLSLPGNIGTADSPVVLVVNGNLDLGSNVEVNGLVFVTGSITGNGSPTIYGALIGGGTATANGNLKVIYDPLVLDTAGRSGRASKLSGSWRDW